MPFRSSIENKIKYFEKEFDVYNNIYVSRSAILNNFDLLSKLSPGGLVIPVLKSNAYGHGLEQVATILKSRNFPYIAVDGYFEGLQIHKVSKQPILVMGAIKSVNFANINPRNYAFAVSDIASIEAMGTTHKPFKIHIELETGMGRHGVRIDELSNLLSHTIKYNNLSLEGVMTHLADADNPKSAKHVELQTKRFDLGVRMILKAGFKPKYIHIAQSAGSTKVNSTYANTLRVGIALYGVTPLDHTDSTAIKLKGLRPALALTSTISRVLEVDGGESVGYGRTFVARRKSRIGVLPLGYYEGLPRTLSNTGKVKWQDKYLPFAGRMCMNHTMIDITDSNAAPNDTVTVISADSLDALSINNICLDNKLFNYGLLAGLNQNIRRTIVE
jgi:alanine racemase